MLASQTRAPASETTKSAETILASQPSDLVDRLMEERMIVFQEIREEGPLRGGIVNAYVIFDQPIDRVYPLLAQSARQVEFRPELTSIETIEMGPLGPIDEQRLRILFRTYMSGDAYWMPWFKKAVKVLAAMQRKDGEIGDQHDNTIYSTAMSSIVLQAPKGYLPIYER